ncbi:SDR family NAD(P)-dependent oxidoreductase [candidate division KSB1 bacterium]|nr:SDR family NAD(P)-dependent oxidoreductase [candidate division KSB1 bacterium]RQW07061.1 MAG: SDR family NAD(P)-dependent oxidoreductase [candidate division KSB1 bacterium]
MAKKNRWSSSDIPNQSGRLAVVTGGNSGIGYETALALAAKNATVILACRDEKRGEIAAEKINTANGVSNAIFMRLDLASLRSVREFSDNFRRTYAHLDLLINNAGVMMPPYGETEDGFELQFGVNHLGHFALTGLLLDSVLRTAGSRIVTVSSSAHQWGAVNFDDLNCGNYSRVKAYGQSKIANLYFTYELQRRLERAGVSAIAVAAHPGWTATNLQQHAFFFRALNPVLGQSPAMGALPTLYAATAPDVRGGDYYGPDGFMQSRGYPIKVQSNALSHDRGVAERLWRASEELTQVSFALQ